MRKPPKIDPTDPVALSTWLTEVRAVTTDLHALSVDATAPKGHRRHSRAHLRAQTCRRFQLLNALLAGACTGVCARDRERSHGNEPYWRPDL